MDRLYYTYNIHITNRTAVQVEKRGPGNEMQGEPHGSFAYSGKSRTRINELYQAARIGHLVGSEVQELGTLLFDTLFDAGIRSDFFNLYERMRREGALLRLELDVDERQLPEVVVLPWECMCVPPSAGYGTIWLGTAPDLTFSRRRAHWNAPPPIQLAAGERLRIALVVSTPDELGPVKYEKIWEELRVLSSIQGERLELLDLVTSATRSKIDAVLEQKPHIFHFIGHGRLKDEHLQEAGQVALTDEIRPSKARWLGAELFSELFTRHQPSIVLLQACEGAALSASKAFVGVASQVVQQNIPVVVSMQYEISNATAQRFALKFYEHLAKNDPVDKAVQEGRRHIALGPIGYTGSDFATPVLFMRAGDGRLFLPTSEEAEQYPTRQKTTSNQTIIKAKKKNIAQVIKAKDKGIAIGTMYGNVNQYNDPETSSIDEEE